MELTEKEMQEALKQYQEKKARKSRKSQFEELITNNDVEELPMWKVQVGDLFIPKSPGSLSKYFIRPDGKYDFAEKSEIGSRYAIVPSTGKLSNYLSIGDDRAVYRVKGVKGDRLQRLQTQRKQQTSLAKDLLEGLQPFLSDLGLEFKYEQGDHSSECHLTNKHAQIRFNTSRRGDDYVQCMVVDSYESGNNVFKANCDNLTNLSPKELDTLAKHIAYCININRSK